MVDYNKMRLKFPAKGNPKKRKSAAIKAIAREFEMKKAELGLSAPIVKRGFPYYMTIIIGLLVIGGLVGTAISKKGGIDIAGRNRSKAEKSIHALAVALGRYRYHVGTFPSTEEGLEQLASKNVTHRGWNGPYIRVVNLDPWKREYVYVYNGESEPPTLYSKGPDGAAGTTDDVIANRADFDLAFRDTSWTKEWVPMHLRDIVVAQDEEHKRQLEEEVRQILHPEIPAEGETLLSDGWKFIADGTGSAAGWRPVAMPHDWRAHPGTRSAPAGRYVKEISIPEKAAGRYVALRFARICGAYSVSLDGVELASGESGRRPVEVRLDGVAKAGGTYYVEVNVAADPASATEYIGAGIAGNVTMAVEKPEGRLIGGTLKVETLSLDADMAKMRMTYETPEGAVANDFELASPRVWTPARPHLYKGYLAGRMHQYAVRTISFDEGGCVLNGERLELRGVDLPRDNGLEGMAGGEAVLRRRLQRFKDIDANAVHFAGSDATEEERRLCDEMGFVVCDTPFGVQGVDPLPGGDGTAESPGAPRAGLCDIAGYPRQAYFERMAQWRPEAPALNLFPHWNWNEGETVRVACATAADEVELFVNGESKGRRTALPGTAKMEWDVPYEPGEVKAIAFKKGAYTGETAMKTAGKPFRARLTPDKSALADGESTIVRVEGIDGEGIANPLASGAVVFELEGPGVILAVGNAAGMPDATYGANSCAMLEGRCYAIVRRTGGSGLPLRLVSKPSAFRPAAVTIPRR